MRTRSSIYNMIVKLAASVLPSVLGVFLNKLIISKFGSDINGLVSTFGQVMNFLTIFEGGLTLATNVALYKPYVDKNYSLINNILTATKIIYLRIGIIISIISIIIALLIPRIVNSGLDNNFITILFLIISANLIIQFLFGMKYDIMFSVSQKEYISNIYKMIFNILSQCASIAVILFGANILSVKLISLIVITMRIPVLVLLFRFHFPSIGFKSSTPDFSVLKATKDVLFQKLALLVFDSTDMVIISIFISTMHSSIYSVYNMIYTSIKLIIFAIVLAPFNAFGQLYSERLTEKFSEYNTRFQYISICVANVFISTTSILVIPFIKLYTKNVSDINYIDAGFAMLFSIFCSMQILSNVLGVVTNSTGQFREMKFISLAGAIINIIVSMLLIGTLGIRGVLIGSIVAYIIMLFFQMYLVHIKMLKNGLIRFLSILIENIFFSIILIYSSFKFPIYFSNYFHFILVGGEVFIIIMISVLLYNYLLNKKLSIDIFMQVKNGLK